jgi:hypothetical protein
MRSSARIGLLWVCLLAACAPSNLPLRPASEPPEVVSSWEEGCEDARTLLLLCEEEGETCGLYRCHEMATTKELYRHAGALIFRFNLTGPIVPYSQRKAEVP